MSKIIFIVSLFIVFSTSSAMANESVNKFVQEKRANAAYLKEFSMKRAAHYKYLKSQGKPIVLGITVNSRQKIEIQDLENLEDIATASGEKEQPSEAGTAMLDDEPVYDGSLDDLSRLLVAN